MYAGNGCPILRTKHGSAEQSSVVVTRRIQYVVLVDLLGRS